MPEQNHDNVSTDNSSSRATETSWGRGSYQLSVVRIKSAEDNAKLTSVLLAGGVDW